MASRCEHRVVATATAELDRAFRALADPSRRQFITRLADGPLSVKELHAATGLTLAAVVQHVQLLEGSGLITTRKEGRVRTCSLSDDGLGRVEGWLADRRRTWSTRLDRLGAVLDERAES